MPPVIQTLVRRGDLEQATLTDPASKFRVCTPENLIDTDFEYGLQPTKWETLQLVNNIPSFFSRTHDDILVQDVLSTKGSAVLTVTTAAAHRLVVGTAITLNGLKSSSAEGMFFVLSVPTPSTFLYRSNTVQTYSGSICDPNTSLSIALPFQGTQYTIDCIEHINTNEGNPSKLNVTTRYPHGFSIGTRFSIVNSIGKKQISFDASAVDPIETIVTTCDIETAADNLNGYGFSLKKVNPYDWTAKKALYFSPINVNTSTHYINIVGHGLSSGMKVMYVPPVGDSPVGGLVPYQLYNTVVVDTNHLYLTDMSAPVNNGFHYKVYGGNYAQNVSWFSKYKPSSVGATTNINNIYSFTGVTPSSTNISIEATGYFRPTSTGTWYFYSTSDDYSYMWIGDNAINGYTTANALLQGGGQANAPVELVADVFYPVRIHLCNGSGIAQMELAFEGPNTSRRTDGSGFFFHGSGPTTASEIKRPLTGQGTGNFGYHALLKSFLVNGVDIATGEMVVKADDPIAANSPIAVFSRDSSKKSFGLECLSVSTNNISASAYTKYYVSSTFPSGEETRLRLCKSPNGHVMDITVDLVHGVTWVVPITVIAEYDSFFVDKHGFATDDAVTYSLISGTGPPELTDGTTYFLEVVNNAAFRLKATAGTATTIDISSIGNGIVRFTKSAPNPYANTIYCVNHDLVDGEQVVYDPNSNPTIAGLSEYVTYYVMNSTKDRFALRTEGTQQAINMTSPGTGIHHITSTGKATDGMYVIGSIINDRTFSLDAGFKIPSMVFHIDPAKTVVDVHDIIYIPCHRMRTGTAVIYSSGGGVSIGGLVAGSTYYIIRVDTNYVRLATTVISAMSNLYIALSGGATGSSHTLTAADITGEIYIPSALSITNGSTTARAIGGMDLMSLTKVGDRLKAEIPFPEEIISISSIDIETGVVTLEGGHGMADGDHVFYSSGTPSGGLVDGCIYYIRATGNGLNQITMFDTYADAVAGTNMVYVSSSTAGTIIKRGVGYVFEATVTETRSKSEIVVSAAPSASGVARMIVSTSIFPFSDGYVVHRPYDGGVEMVPGTTPDCQIIRQTRKCFRYQSGKGMQVSNSINFSAPTDILSLTRTGNVAYAKLRKPHRLKVGTVVVVGGVVGGLAWEGSHQVTSIPSANVFTYTLATTPQETVAGGFPSFTLLSWVNSKTRVGMFDDQNGLFYEHDGNQLCAVRRSSTKQIPGECTVAFGSALVTGIDTRFTTTLVAGDMVVIKGQSYKVVNIANDNAIYVQPLYRGCSSVGVVLSKTIDTRVPQSKWSIDPCDGTGPSAFSLDINKMQMVYIDYSWYGAGKVRFGAKGANGEVMYVHEFIHNNTQTEAYMRTGNLPARYEVATVGVPSYVQSLMHWGTSIIMDGKFDIDKSYLYTTSGVQLSYTGGDTMTFNVDIASGDTSTMYNMYDPTFGGMVCAYRITATVYTTVQNIKSGTTLSGIGLQAGTKTVSSPTKASGSAGYVYIDKAPSVASNSSITAGDIGDFLPSFIPLISIRLAPSVDNGRPGALGSREIVNRMQLILKSIGILTTHDCEIKLLLNAYPFTKSWVRVTPPSLSQLIYHAKGDTIAGGTQIYNFRVSGGTPDSTGKRYSVNTTTSLEELAALGNSIMGGDDVFPNGPDLLTIGATVLEASGISVTTPCTVTGRLTWAESQA